MFDLSMKQEKKVTMCPRCPPMYEKVMGGGVFFSVSMIMHLLLTTLTKC